MMRTNSLIPDCAGFYAESQLTDSFSGIPKDTIFKAAVRMIARGQQKEL